MILNIYVKKVFLSFFFSLYNVNESSKTHACIISSLFNKLFNSCHFSHFISQQNIIHVAQAQSCFTPFFTHSLTHKALYHCDKLFRNVHRRRGLSKYQVKMIVCNHVKLS